MNIDEIKKKIQTGKATHNEIAWALLRDKYVLFNFLIDNNLPSVNAALKINLGLNYLPFAANRKAVEAAIDNYIRKNDMDALNTIIQNFVYNPNANNYTSHQDVLLNMAQHGKDYHEGITGNGATTARAKRGYWKNGEWYQSGF